MPSDPLTGTTLIDRYEILSEVGKGRVGVVYKATHKQLDRTVAVKVLFEDVGGKELSFRRFEREARASGSLNHPNIIMVYDFGLSPGGFPFLVMEFVEGTDLHQIVGHGRMAIPRAVRIVTQVCSALSHAHKRGIVHRDLKPSNIMLVDDVEDMPDFVKLVDFGIAKRFDVEDDSEKLTMDGQVLGTPAYMSPEQCCAGKIDARSDVYSLGCVMFKMLTGHTPIVGTSLIEIMQNHVKQAPMSFSDATKELDFPAPIEAVVMKSLQKDPMKRQQSMAELRSELLAAFATCADQRSDGVLVTGSAPSTSLGGRTHEVLLDGANNGDCMAQYELALRLRTGDGVDADLEESAKWLRAAAQNGQREAQFRIGKQLLIGEDGLAASPTEGVRWLKLSADQGYEQAEAMVASCFEEGRGTAVDLPSAIKYYKAAANRGNKQAEYRLAQCFIRCHESGQTADGMMDWMIHKAQQGDVDAMFALSAHYQKAGSDPELRMRAFDYLSEAAKLGHVPAQINLAEALFKGDGVQANPAEGLRWLEQASNSGNPEATITLACALKNGWASKADPLRASQLLQKASDDGNLYARAVLSSSMLIGDGMPRNITRGITMLKSAAADGNGLAQWKYALCASSGLGMVRDLKEAEKWFDKAAEQRFDQGPPWRSSVPGLAFSDAIATFNTLVQTNHKLALYWLGLCCEDGNGVPVDPFKAVELYTKSAVKGNVAAGEAANRLKLAMGRERSETTTIGGVSGRFRSI